MIAPGIKFRRENRLPETNFELRPLRQNRVFRKHVIRPKKSHGNDRNFRLARDQTRAALRFPGLAVFAPSSFGKEQNRVPVFQNAKHFFERGNVRAAVAVNRNHVAIRQNLFQERIVLKRLPRQKKHFLRNAATDQRRIDEAHVVARNQTAAFRKIVEAVNIELAKRIHERARAMINQRINNFVCEKIHFVVPERKKFVVPEALIRRYRSKNFANLRRNFFDDLLEI